MRSLFWICLLAGLSHVSIPAAEVSENALERYVRAEDSSWSWKVEREIERKQSRVFYVDLVSQVWRGHRWTHRLVIVRPKTVAVTDAALLFVTGDTSADKQVPMLEQLALAGGAPAALLTHVPNQPLYDGRKEDALIAFTFERYLRTGDETWPLLFPMVKSAVRAMDTLQALGREQWKSEIKRFVVTGASKRGWTTWLTAAVDDRVAGIAPMVIDMLNMKAQVDWARRAFGSQSEMIRDYTELGLIDKMDAPPMVKLRSWVDPWSHRERYTMPKLILLGTNDPYWVVDSLRHYWSDLPEPKWIYQTPNAGHDLGGGKEALKSLSAFYAAVARGESLPRVSWKLEESPEGRRLHLILEAADARGRYWQAESEDRDFRNDPWNLAGGEVFAGGTLALTAPGTGYRAYLGEVALESPHSGPYRLSTEVVVVPDGLPAAAE